MPRTHAKLLRLIGAALVLGLSASALAACSSGGPEQVRFMLSKPEAIPYFRDLIKEYNASQGDVEVVLDSASNLQAGFLRGNPPDLGLLNYNMEMARFMERGALSDLSDMPEAKRILPEVQKLVDQYASYPGRTSVLPYSVMAASVIYNKQIFADNGIEVPDHLDELVTACETLKAAGVTPFYGTFKDPWTIAQGWFDYTVGGTVDVAVVLRRDEQAGHQGRAGLGGVVREDHGQARRAHEEALQRVHATRMPRAGATATATSPSPRARPRCTCRGRGPSARSPRPARTSISAPSRCR